MSEPWTPWHGPTLHVLPGSDRDLCRELLGTLDAIRDGSTRLTKNGIPPKPLWNALNERLLWQDPRSILYDWDEVDQIRFVYCIAQELRLFEPDPERVLLPGPGADAFFLAPPVLRNALLARAWTRIRDWDERCDARDDDGHRHNFGQTFRRDFRVDIQDLRELLLDVLATLPPDTWIDADEFALRVTERNLMLLVSEDDPPPPVRPGEPESEIRRLVHWWVFLAARMGWLDLARGPAPPDDDPDGDPPEATRLLRITPMARAVFQPDALDAIAHRESLERAQARPFVILPTLDIVLYRHLADAADEYLLRRACEEPGPGGWDEPTLSFRIGRASLQSALRTGLDLDLWTRWVVERSQQAPPSALQALLHDARRDRSACEAHLQAGWSAIELAPEDPDAPRRLRELGFEVFDRLALIPWTRLPVALHALGGEPPEAFEYPIDPEEPLASLEGDILQLRWGCVPLVSRDLLDDLGFGDERLEALLDDLTLQRLFERGWSERALADAIVCLTGGPLPRRLRATLR